MEETVQTQMNELLEKSKKVAVIPISTGVDAFAAALGLYLLLKNRGKDTSFIYQSKKPDQFSDLIFDQELTSDVTSRDVVIHVDYAGTTASKVTYNTNNGLLTFKLGPVKKDFDLQKVTSEISSLNYDVIFTVGAQSLESFGDLYKDLTIEFSKAVVINIDCSDKNQRFGKVNVVDTSVDTLSLLVLNTSLLWGLKITQKAALALLRGMTYKEELKS